MTARFTHVVLGSRILFGWKKKTHFDLFILCLMGIRLFPSWGHCVWCCRNILERIVGDGLPVIFWGMSLRVERPPASGSRVAAQPPCIGHDSELNPVPGAQPSATAESHLSSLMFL